MMSITNPPSSGESLRLRHLEDSNREMKSQLRLLEEINHQYERRICELEGYESIFSGFKAQLFDLPAGRNIIDVANEMEFKREDLQTFMKSAHVPQDVNIFTPADVVTSCRNPECVSRLCHVVTLERRIENLKMEIIKAAGELKGL